MVTLACWQLEPSLPKMNARCRSTPKRAARQHVPVQFKLPGQHDEVNTSATSKMAHGRRVLSKMSRHRFSWCDRTNNLLPQRPGKEIQPHAWLHDEGRVFISPGTTVTSALYRVVTSLILLEVVFQDHKFSEVIRGLHEWDRRDSCTLPARDLRGTGGHA